MHNEKVRFILHLHFIMKTKKKSVGDAKFGNDAMLSASSASFA